MVHILADGNKWSKVDRHNAHFLPVVLASIIYTVIHNMDTSAIDTSVTRTDRGHMAEVHTKLP